MAIDRLERILYKLAQRYAPHLTPAGWIEADDKIRRVQKLSRDLARYSVLVMVGKVTTPKAIDVQVQQWVNLHAQFYGILARALFPTFSRIEAQYADDLIPPVVVLTGDASPIFNQMAGIIIPYIAMRQPQEAQVTDAELLALMTVLLKHLEAEDLPAHTYAEIQHQCASLLRQLLRCSVEQVTLTVFDKPVIENIITTKPKEIPLKPTLLPKTGRLNPLYGEPPKDPQPTQNSHPLEPLPEDNSAHTPTEMMFIKDIRLDRTQKRVLPVPDLPKPTTPKKDDAG